MFEILIAVIATAAVLVPATAFLTLYVFQRKLLNHPETAANWLAKLKASPIYASANAVAEAISKVESGDVKAILKLVSALSPNSAVAAAAAIGAALAPDMTKVEVFGSSENSPGRAAAAAAMREEE